MKILLVTEKHEPKNSERDGGARVVNTLKESFGSILSIMQFGSKNNLAATWNFDYPIDLPNRFEKRIANAKFIAEQIKKVEKDFTHILFVHISMQFGIIDIKLKENIIIWTFPMFLTPSYQASGELIPDKYIQLEHLALAEAQNIITPSHFEKHQLINYYSIPQEKIHVVPRGIDTDQLIPKVTRVNLSSDGLKFCSIGSIKSQKNTLGLINLFVEIQAKFPESKLKIIGPNQNDKYFKEVCERVEELGLSKSVELTGYLPPHELFRAVEDCHIHISRSTCETFGRSIFETLACGLPNIAKKTGNGAAEFLDGGPYAKFIDDDKEVIKVIPEILGNFSQLSSMALEVGKLYDDQILAKLLVAKFYNKEVIAISDFDGTLFHKADSKRTEQSIEEFKRFRLRVICSARTIDDLLNRLKVHNLEVDWIIGCSGGVVADGNGNILWVVPLMLDKNSKSELSIPEAKRIEVDGTLLQIAIPTHLLPTNFIPNMRGLRAEVYDNTVFIANWQASKLHAAHKLLRHINWSGQVKVFGDSKYDMELINYFDGVKVTTVPNNNVKNKELNYD